MQPDTAGLLEPNGSLVPSSAWFKYLWIHHHARTVARYVKPIHRTLLDSWMSVERRANLTNVERSKVEATLFWNKFVSKKSLRCDNELRQEVTHDYKTSIKCVSEGKDPLHEWLNLDSRVEEHAQVPPLDFGPPEIESAVSSIVDEMRRMQFHVMIYQVPEARDFASVGDDLPDLVSNEEREFLLAQRQSLLEVNSRKNEPTDDSDIPVPVAEPDETTVDGETLTPEQKKQLCITCCERYIAVLFSPCGHMSLCVTCSLKHHRADRKHTCPTCRTAYERIIKLRPTY